MNARRWLIVLALLAGRGELAGWAQPTGRATADNGPLARRVSLPALSAPLEMVLREVARRGNVGLAYSATRLPLSATVAVPAQTNERLSAVLAAVLHNQPVAYGVLDGQVVLWRQDDAPPPGVQVASSAAASKSQRGRPTSRTLHTLGSFAATGPAPTAATAARPDAGRSSAASVGRMAPGTSSGKPTTSTGPAIVSTGPTSRVAGMSAGGLSAGQPTTANQRGVKTTFSSAGASSRASASSSASKGEGSASQLTAGVAPVVRGAASLANLERLVPRTVTLAVRADSTAVPPLLARRPVARPAAAVAWAQRAGQVSLVPPLSTNWRTNGRTVNRISLNLLAGYAAGVRGVEVGGVLNAVRDSVAGLQVAGVVNAAGGPVVGAQVAGLVNVARGPLEGVQSAGLWNVARGPAQGWQSAGLFNLSRNDGPAADAATSPEPLVQLAGLFNSAPRGIKGAQVAGLFNAAGRVQGVQIAGLLNVADSVAGVSLAPLNFVRHGYHAFELTSDGTWPAMLSLKLGGSSAFYTYFVGAWAPAAPQRWGIGYGLGGEISGRQRLSLSLDAHGLQVNQDDGSLGTWARELNMHTQFRALVGWATGPKRRLRLVAGPTFNLLVTQRRASVAEPAGQLLPTSGITFLEDVDFQGVTRTQGWLNALVGLRWKF